MIWLRGYVACLVDGLKDRQLDPEEAAYGLAGLLSYEVARSLGEHEPARQLLELAGYLELPPEHQPADVSWSQFYDLVELL